jgi:hypothetical protein
MSTCASLPAKLLAAHVILFGGAAANAALAQDTAPDTSQIDTDANPIDTTITTQPPSHSKHGLKARSSKKFTSAHSSGNPPHHYRNLLHGNAVSVVRNSIGQTVQINAYGKGIEPKAFERAAANGASGNTSVATSGGAPAGIDSQHQGLVPLRARPAVPHDPRLSMAINRLIINGRDIIRRGVGAGAIGGAAKNNSGGISGTDFRLARP